jgi:Fur family ferric uptake transcriptional regulator
MKQAKSADPAASDLKKAGLRVTLPRLKILQLLVSHPDNHVTAEDVYREFMAAGEEIGLATIYRVLTQFEAAGLVKRHHFEGAQSVFELDEGGHHDHLLCLRCGKVVEFYDEIIEERQQVVAKSKGFELRDHSMILYGVCSDPDCTSES